MMGIIKHVDSGFRGSTAVAAVSSVKSTDDVVAVSDAANAASQDL